MSIKKEKLSEVKVAEPKVKKLSELEMVKLDLLNEIKQRKEIEKMLAEEIIQKKKLEIELTIHNFNQRNNNDTRLDDLSKWFDKLKEKHDLKDGFGFDRDTGEIQNPEPPKE